MQSGMTDRDRAITEGASGRKFHSAIFFIFIFNIRGSAHNVHGTICGQRE